jgi:F-type H+-transporting ATPase subunit a
LSAYVYLATPYIHNNEYPDFCWNSFFDSLYRPAWCTKPILAVLRGCNFCSSAQPGLLTLVDEGNKSQKIVMIDVVLAPRTYFQLGPFLITDANLGALIVTVLLLMFVAFSYRRFSLVPTRLQVIVEATITNVYDRLRQALNSDQVARQYLPLFITLLLFIFIANQLTILPFLFDIIWNDATLIRQPTSDLSGTLTLSLIVVLSANILAVMISPWGHLRTFFPVDNLFKARSGQEVMRASIDLALGLLNIIGEFAKVVSLSCRLFGNIFAGNVIILVLAGLSTVTGFILPIPFLILSIFSGLVQAYVFTALSMEFTLGPVVNARDFMQQKRERLAHK